MQITSSPPLVFLKFFVFPFFFFQKKIFPCGETLAAIVIILKAGEEDSPCSGWSGRGQNFLDHMLTKPEYSLDLLPSSSLITFITDLERISSQVLLGSNHKIEHK